MAGSVKEVGGKLTYTDKNIVLKGSSRVSTQGGAVAVLEDFVGSLTTASYALINQAGTPLTAAAISAAAGGASGQAGSGGWVAGKTDDVDAEIDEVALGAAPWIVPARAGNGLSACEFGFVIPTALTARQYFCGFSDDETEGTATNGALNIQSALTTVDVAADAVGFIFSSLATAPTVWKYSNTKAGTQATNATTAAITATVDEYLKFRVEVDSAGVAYLYGATAGATTGGRSIEMGYIATVVDAVTASAPLVPLFSAAPTTTTGVEWEIDYIFGAGRA